MDETMPNEIREAIDRGEVTLGMTPEQVRQAWGGTGCVFQDQFEGNPAEVWGYGRDPASQELIGIPDCDRAVLILYFVDGKVADWASREES